MHSTEGHTHSTPPSISLFLSIYLSIYPSGSLVDNSFFHSFFIAVQLSIIPVLYDLDRSKINAIELGGNIDAVPVNKLANLIDDKEI